MTPASRDEPGSSRGGARLRLRAPGPLRAPLAFAAVLACCGVTGPAAMPNAGDGGDALDADTTGEDGGPDDTDTGPGPTCTWSWEPVGTGGTPPGPLWKHLALFAPELGAAGRMLVVGGGGEPSDRGHLYDLATDSWSETTILGEIGPGSKGVWTGSLFVFYPGGRYDPAVDEFEPFGDDPGMPPVMLGPSAVFTGAEMILVGYPYACGVAYDIGNRSWYELSPGPGGDPCPEERSDHSAVWTGSEMIVWGGVGFPWPDGLDYLDSGGRYDPVAGQWRSTWSGQNQELWVPPGRASHVAVWTGGEMIVWGGDGPYYLPEVTSGAAYRPAEEDLADPGDPDSSPWHEISPEGAPPGREAATAVWTGTEMIVWGGLPVQDDQNPALGDGGHYDPLADTWRPAAADGAPSPRGCHTAIWTGHEMIVWGGTASSEAGGDPLADGGRYRCVPD